MAWTGCELLAKSNKGYGRISEDMAKYYGL
jgi:hypothetical protein